MGKFTAIVGSILVASALSSTMVLASTQRDRRNCDSRAFEMARVAVSQRFQLPLDQLAAADFEVWPKNNFDMVLNAMDREKSSLSGCPRRQLQPAQPNRSLFVADRFFWVERAV